MCADDRPFWTVTVSSAASSALVSFPNSRLPDTGRERNRNLQLWIIVAAGPFPGVGPAMIEHIFALAMRLEIGGRRSRDAARPLHQHRKRSPAASFADTARFFQQRQKCVARGMGRRRGQANPMYPPAGRTRPAQSARQSQASRSAIAFPDKRIGVNFSCLALSGRANCPAIDPASLTNLCNPWPGQSADVDGQEMRRCRPNGPPSIDMLPRVRK